MGYRCLFPFLVLVIFLGLVFTYLRHIEGRTIFYPAREMEVLPAVFGLAYEEIVFKTADNLILNGWFLPQQVARYNVLFCHGNAGNISHRLEKLKFFHDLGCNVFIFDYRGYGKSQGAPSEKGLYRDVEAAYRYLLQRKIAPETIIGYGESLGGAVIIDLAFRYRLAGLIIDSSFNSAKDMVRVIYPFVPYWAFASRWDSESKVKSIDIPKLFIHSINDEIVPFKLGRKLYQVAVENKDFLEIRGGHNSCFFESQQLYQEKVSAFLSKLAR
jgi:fermentation-respiration switch protein FrsA (DUF1100 family)